MTCQDLWLDIDSGVKKEHSGDGCVGFQGACLNRKCSRIFPALCSLFTRCSGTGSSRSMFTTVRHADSLELAIELPVYFTKFYVS